MMDLFSTFPTQYIVFAAIIALFAGVIKGAVGFAMPMVMMTCLTLFLTPETALALLIVPTLISNMIQALRQGFAAAWHVLHKFWIFLVVGCICLLLSAQLIRFLPTEVMFLFLGAVISGFAILQLSGWQPRLEASSNRLAAGIGAFAGTVGGLSGIWGPPTVAYLTAINTPKEEQLRIQGVIYGLGAVALLCGHVGSGLVTKDTFLASAFLAIPAVMGLSLGYAFQKKIDQNTFRKLTLIVLVFGGLNLIRHGLLS